MTELNGCKRLNALFDGNTIDKLCWSTLVDDHTLRALPEHLQGMSCLEFYRYIGCDIVQLGGWCLPWELQGCQLVKPGVNVESFVDESGNNVTQEHTKRGTLTSKLSKHGHPIEYPVKDINDLRAFASSWEEAWYEKVDDTDSYAAIERAVGDDGIVTLFTAPSAIPDLLENVIGIEQFYYLLMDYPDEMDALIDRMQQAEHERFRLIAEGPWDMAILVENTSTRYISPAVYEKYNLHSQHMFVEALHKRGKKAILHMCGHVRDLLPMIKETNADGIHALTPPPLGDTPWDLALDVLGNDIIIFGCLTPDIFQEMPLDEMGTALDRLLTTRLRESRLVICLGADGIAVPVERFLAVRDWIDSHKK